MDFKGILLGFKASLIASSCCTLPLILAVAFSMMGVGSITAALAIPKYKYFFITAAQHSYWPHSTSTSRNGVAGHAG
ncbi:MAG: hypothetical protein ABIH11_06775 [Candidatus Altiarchaeota archaeon]